ncbi:YmfL family putative regulatory protein [Serratia fonticola]|uniref:YmfL family putative regulatory protein n=1 Tax=Serratia fonticola TaxID=47917 RepID=A0AAJ1YGR3_SERFO|nr:YmfL family putative regulatory protein [Serratia fonticola]MDQ9129719.1 YmfL family putative regulatory protein [Serratia fonticola]
MSNKSNWQAEKQPSWLVASIRKCISALPGGYDEAPEWLGKKEQGDTKGVTKDSLFNRLRTDGDQIFPLGWAMVLQRAGGTYHVAHAVARASGGIFIPMPELEEIDNADINQRLIEAFEQIGRYSQEVKKAIEDGVIDPSEQAAITDELYLTIAKLQEHSTLVFRVFCPPEKGDAQRLQPLGVGANKTCVEN